MSKLPVSRYYRVPNDLQRTQTPLTRVLVIGSCLVAGLPDTIRTSDPECEVDYILFNNVVELPSQPPAPLSSYNLLVVQIAVRSILPESMYFRLPYDDENAYADLFESAKARLIMSLDAVLRYTREAAILTFVSNFLVPQANPFGRMLPRYDLRNPVYFVEMLNQFLDTQLRTMQSCHILDVDEISATFGKKFIQDDAVWQINHASALSDADFENDQCRLEPVKRASELYQTRIWEFALATWAEIVGMYRTLKKLDTVKAVIIDLDDTLWRGVLAEEGARTVEGWPLGIAEALLFLKKRGVILAIASKNDPEFISKHFNSVFGTARLQLEDFAVRKIGWAPKTEAIAEIIQELNILPESVLFIDDNPVERASAQDTFPSIRVIGGNLYATRRILLWAPETQVEKVTEESAKRTEMVVAQLRRESLRSSMSREAFLDTLNVCIIPLIITETTHRSFQRVTELVNKSNQFNTTGRRWTHQDFVAGFADGLRIFAFQVEDKFTEYGLVIVALVDGVTIRQFVMSCRVIGLGVEEAAIAQINREIIKGGAAQIRGLYVASQVNYLCKDLFEKTGFRHEGDVWVRAAEPCATTPSHILVKTHGPSVTQS